MHLSNVYENRSLWIMVYHIQPDSEVVEMVSDKIFTSETEAWVWFHDRYHVHDFIQPEVLQIKGLNHLALERPEKKVSRT